MSRAWGTGSSAPGFPINHRFSGMAGSGAILASLLLIPVTRMPPLKLFPKYVSGDAKQLDAFGITLRRFGVIDHAKQSG